MSVTFGVVKTHVLVGVFRLIRRSVQWDLNAAVEKGQRRPPREMVGAARTLVERRQFAVSKPYASPLFADLCPSRRKQTQQIKYAVRCHHQ